MNAISEDDLINQLKSLVNEVTFDGLGFKTQNTAYHWFQAMVDLQIKPVRFFWSQIDPALHSKDLLQLAVALDCTMLKDIGPEDVNDYLECFMSAFSVTSFSIKNLHPDYQTAKTIEAMLDAPGSFHRVYRNHPWIAKAITPELTERASQLNVLFMGHLPRTQISEAALASHLTKGFHGYFRLRGVGKLKLAADFMKCGHWPEPDGQYESHLKKPGSAQDAFASLRSTMDAKEAAVYMAYLMSQPIEEVIALMGNKNYMHLVKEMYTVDELRPLMKTNRYLSGVLLEDALGL